MRGVEIEGVKVWVGSWREWLKELEDHWGEFWGVAPIALHPLAVANRDREFKQVLQAVDCVLPDSVWHRRLIRWRWGEVASERFYGPELMRSVVEWVGMKGGKVWLLGGKDAMQIERLKQWVQQVGRGVEVEGWVAGRPVREEELRRLVKRVSKEKGVVFLGVGSPQQQELILELKKLGLKVPVIAVGAAFDFWSGEKRMCPRWLRRLGLEWGWRLVQEPRRLGKRYWETMKYVLFSWMKGCGRWFGGRGKKC